MSNVLKVSLLAAIYSLHDKGWSRRRIAPELGLNRETVGRYLRLAKPAISTVGFEEPCQAKPAISTTGTMAGRKSQCEPLAEAIRAKVEVGLSARRILPGSGRGKWLRADSYESVKRFVRKLRASHPERVWRLECQPGEELQLDFGLGAPIDEGQGKTRRSWILRLVLSYSRKGYSEALYRQDTETFLRCLENGLRSFGGTPLLLNLDNFKAAVRNADWFDPDINPKLADFCRHYGMHVLPCRPGRPEHKGKVERGIAYVGSNALKVSFLSRWPTLNELQRAEAHTVRSFFYAHNSRSRSRIEKRLQQIGQAHEVTDDPALIEPMILTTKCLVAQLRQFNRAINGFDRKIKELFKSHPDHFLFEALPGAGEKLAPRLLVLFGSDRSRWPDATDIQKYSGIAPVIERSGKSVWVHRRLSRPIFVCQTFHEFAQQSTRFSPWADQFYRRQREKGKSHHSAIRSLAFKWIRIVFACWKANEPYDESLYVNALAKRTSSPSST